MLVTNKKRPAAMRQPAATFSIDIFRALVMSPTACKQRKPPSPDANKIMVVGSGTGEDESVASSTALSLLAKNPTPIGWPIRPRRDEITDTD